MTIPFICWVLKQLYTERWSKVKMTFVYKIKIQNTNKRDKPSLLINNFLQFFTSHILFILIYKFLIPQKTQPPPSRVINHFMLLKKNLTHLTSTPSRGNEVQKGKRGDMLGVSAWRELRSLWSSLAVAAAGIQSDNVTTPAQATKKSTESATASAAKWPCPSYCL